MAENHNNLVRRQYATDVNLRIRQDTHNKYSIPNRSFAEWVLKRAQLRGGERILDVGCGNGIYFDKIQQNELDLDYVGLDLLKSMIQNHPLTQMDGKLLLGDAQEMPFEDDCFDLIMANHMLHHIEDIDKSIAEIRRILKPSGLLVVATNSHNTMPELQVLMRRAIVLLTRTGAAQVRAPQMPSDRFALENGTLFLSNHFYTVVRHDLPGALVFPDVEPAMAYLESTRDLREPALPEDVIWEDVMMIMRQQINQLIKHLGELVINKYMGVLLASDDGSFIGSQISEMKAETQG
jgi:SAM-dependent methyltransferase